MVFSTENMADNNNQTEIINSNALATSVVRVFCVYQSHNIYHTMTTKNEGHLSFCEMANAT